MLERAGVTAQKLAKSVRENGDTQRKEALKLIGVKGLTLIIKESMGALQEPQLQGQPKFLAYSIQDAARAVLELRRRIGKARMNDTCKGQEFIRCVYGTTGTQVQIVVAYVCQERGHAPKYDYDYIVLINVVPRADGIARTAVACATKGP